MTFNLFLSIADAHRAARVLAKLEAGGLREFALTGGLAVELQLAAHGHSPQARPLNDIDIVVPSFGALPAGLADGFLNRHIHAQAPAGKMLLQLADPDEALRIDIFSACGGTLARSEPMELHGAARRVVALEDLAAREASLLMDLARGAAAPRKHARDFERLAAAATGADPGRLAAAWRENRKSRDPQEFRDAAAGALELIGARPDLLVAPEYSRDADAICPKCQETGAFRLAPGRTILSVLGYC
jgi:hypothetical protein